MVERAAEHICFLADVNQLYECALGIYNLELALLIAQQSQKVLYASGFFHAQLLTAKQGPTGISTISSISSRIASIAAKI